MRRRGVYNVSVKTKWEIYMSRIQSVTVMGDSILRGVVLNESTKKYSISNTIGMDSIARMYSMQVTNLSRFGCTVERGYEYVEKYIEKGNRSDVLLLELGGNDSDFDWPAVAAAPDAEHAPRTPLDRFVEVYERLIVLARRQGIVPVPVTLPPVCPERYLRWICRDGLDREAILHWLGDVNTIYRHQERYSRAVEQLARRHGCECIDLRGTFLEKFHTASLYCEDGIHPNPAGQLMIREALISALNKSKGEKIS